MSVPIVELRNATVRFNVGRRNEFDALREVDLSISAGETLGIVGPSGSGKSTLLSIASLLRRPQSGDVLIEGRSITTMSGAAVTACRGRLFGLVTQRGDLFPHWTVLENVLFSARAVGKQLDRTEVVPVLESLGLDARVHHSLPDVLSGGERQRVAIARAIATRPRVLFADEPTSALDSESAAGVLDLLASMKSSQMSIVLVTHDESLVQRMGARIVRVTDGRAEDRGAAA